MYSISIDLSLSLSFYTYIYIYIYILGDLSETHEAHEKTTLEHVGRLEEVIKGHSEVHLVVIITMFVISCFIIIAINIMCIYKYIYIYIYTHTHTYMHMCYRGAQQVAAQPGEPAAAPAAAGYTYIYMHTYIHI